MTTPRDDIAGLIERLLKGAHDTISWHELCAEAATQLDSLLKERFKLITDLADMKSRAISAEQERDALQARAKDQQEGMETIAKEHLELARDFDKLSEMSKASETLRKNALSVAEQWQDRATRAEQERDEAYERAAGVADATMLKFDDMLNTSSVAKSYQERECAVLCAMTSREIADAIRRLAGPEKEKKE